MPAIRLRPGARSLQEDGASFPVIVTGPAGQVRTYAQVDIGSTRSSVDSSLLQRVGAVMRGEDLVQTVTPGYVDLQVASGVALYAP